MQPRICDLVKVQPPAKEYGYLRASGATVPTDGSGGYQTGCIFIHTDGGAETALYVNEGTVTSCDFNAVLTSSFEIADLPDVGATAYTAGAILVADGDSYEEVAVSGDATLASTGALSLANGSVAAAELGVTAGAATASKALVVDANKKLDIGAFSSTTAGSGLVLSAASTNCLSVYADDGGVALTSSHTKVLRGRMLLATAISGGATVTTNGVYGQVKVAADCAVEGYISGVYGYCEAGGAITLTNTTCCFSGVHARVDVPSGATIAASSFVAGVSIFGDLGGTHTGQATAIHVRAADAGDWDTLMEIPAEVVGGSNGGGADTYIDITIAGVPARIAAKYVS